MIRPVRHRWEFELLATTGRYRRSGPIGLRSCAPDLARDGADCTDVRVAYAIGRRVGPAVVRNRIRRRLRHAVAALDADGVMPPGRYLIIVDPRATSSSFDDFCSSLTELVAAP